MRPEEDELVLPSDAFEKITKQPKPRWDDDEIDPYASTYQQAEHGPGPVPDWVITDDAALQYERGELKSGKEATVFVVERQLGERVNLLAVKRYHDPASREFQNDARYREHRRTGNQRVDRAVAKGTRRGRAFRAALWAENEFDVLGRLWSAGAPVPYPVQKLGNELMLEYIGDETQAAPRLSDARLDRSELEDLCSQARAAIVTLARHGVVHGDMSPYNLLAWEGRIVVIDLPQAVDPQTVDGLDLVQRDVENVFGWFARKGVACDPQDVLVDVLAEIF